LEINSLPKKFLIAGCQRSGTTLLRLILESHSDISCRDEPGSYQILSKPISIKETLESERHNSWVGFKIPRYTEQLTFKEIYDYNTPGIPDPFQNFYAGDPIIFIVRDVRDVVCSMLELKTPDHSWFDVWGVPTVKYWIGNLPNFRKKFSTEIDLVKKSNFRYYSTGSLFWKYKNASLLKYVEKNFPILKINYENLVNNPEPILRSIISFLNLEWEENLLKHHTVEHSELSKKGWARGKTDPKKPIRAHSIKQDTLRNYPANK